MHGELRCMHHQVDAHVVHQALKRPAVEQVTARISSPPGIVATGVSGALPLWRMCRCPPVRGRTVRPHAPASGDLMMGAIKFEVQVLT
jgi:hypothetical protein